ncbi:AbrB/MazE/SpoVT family DNA-binding domain-containing protein [Halobacterium litoreum]|uniref:AbrB/MazE/SpoVT family DNA-binding domain-containing protein n=1 Tax=Halobacterium litoreum TaxID=2039234 RepID=A0ABD5NBB6_9EURY|nr:AbrB/MazE/SpoVT family DNA-binding domain-containing protein [Halobacterium litoreum]UHH14545.1 AbrB/MazE/SpoVT family DNA-binding domain-containing protein [Halobacterium litoreum]
MPDNYDSTWPPAAFARDVQTAGERAFEQQTEFMRRMLAPSMDAGLGGLDAMSRTTATFKTRVQSGGRISIPDAEREALGIEEGDIVQTVVIPLETRGDGDE